MSGVQRLLYCNEHQTYKVNCVDIHEERRIKEPLERDVFFDFNDGNNLIAAELKLKYIKGSVYYLTENKKWEKLRVKLYIKENLIEKE